MDKLLSFRRPRTPTLRPFFLYNFCKNITASFTYILLLLRLPVITIAVITIAFSLVYDFRSGILILVGLIPNNKIDSFLSLSLSFSRCLLPQMAVTVPLYGSAISRDILYLLYYYTPPPPPPPPVSPIFFLSRLLTAVCQPSTLPYFSRVLARSGGRRWQWRWMGSALRPPRTPTRATYIQAVSGG